MKKSKNALLLVQKKHILKRYQSERDKARILQRLGESRVIRKGVNTQDTLSFESCMSSVACDMEDMSLETSRTAQEKEEVTYVLAIASGPVIGGQAYRIASLSAEAWKSRPFSMKGQGEHGVMPN